MLFCHKYASDGASITILNSNKMNESISLEFREGGSDKVYHATLEKEATSGLFKVKFAYGRRGSSLTTGTKTPSPVQYYQAKKIYDKLVNEKMGKGYTAFGGQASVAHIAPVVKESAGVHPQLLNETEEESIDALINDDSWGMQEKHDGQRKTMTYIGDQLIIGNKKGIKTSILEETGFHFSASAEKLQIPGLVVDGEDMGEYIVLFDCLSHPGTYSERYNYLEGLNLHTKRIKISPLVVTKDAKRILYNELKKNKAEGVVFKKLDALYKPGRPASGGTQLKFKFRETCSCIVSGESTGKNSISLLALDEKGKEVNIGNATVYPNQVMPAAGEIVEIKYLYYYPGGSLYQPVFLGPRNDVDREECLISKLKAKQEIEAE